MINYQLEEDLKVCKYCTIQVYKALGDVLRKTHSCKSQTNQIKSNQIKSNQILFVTYTWLADVNASVAKCLCF